MFLVPSVGGGRAEEGSGLKGGLGGLPTVPGEGVAGCMCSTLLLLLPSEEAVGISVFLYLVHDLPSYLCMLGCVLVSYSFLYILLLCPGASTEAKRVLVSGPSLALHHVPVIANVLNVHPVPDLPGFW